MSFQNSKAWLIGRSYGTLRKLSFISFYKQSAPDGANPEKSNIKLSTIGASCL